MKVNHSPKARKNSTKPQRSLPDVPGCTMTFSFKNITTDIQKSAASRLNLAIQHFFYLTQFLATDYFFKLYAHSNRCQCSCYSAASGFQPCALRSNSLPSRVTSFVPNSARVMWPMTLTSSMADTRSWSVRGTVKRSS